MNQTTNIDQSCVITTKGPKFTIHNIEDLSIRFTRTLKKDLILVTLLLKTNILAFVYTDNPSELIIYDDYSQKVLSTLKFSNNIVDVQLTRELLIVRTSLALYIYKFSDLSLLKTIDFDIKRDEKNLFKVYGNILAFESNGKISLLDLKNLGIPALDIITGFNTPLCHLALNGDLLAVTSLTGTVIKIYNIKTMNLIKELRRSSTPKVITSMTFYDSNWLAVTSETGTIHIFNLKNEYYSEYVLRPKADMSFHIRVNDLIIIPTILVFVKPLVIDTLSLIVMNTDCLTMVNLSIKKNKILTQTTIAVD